eukprot:scaffold921_cov397-Prasinococcus_capsulatus_cf.AAC.2
MSEQRSRCASLSAALSATYSMDGAHLCELSAELRSYCGDGSLGLHECRDRSAHGCAEQGAGG